MEDENSSEDNKKSNFKYTGLIVLSGLVIVTQAIFGLVVYCLNKDWTQRGQFGDMFGAINTLFSGLAFAGVIYAIFLQRSELELQRDELKLTRTELNRPVVTARVTSFDSGGNLGTALSILVENSGNRPAKNIQLLVKEEDLQTAFANGDKDGLAKQVKECFSERGIIPVLANGNDVANGFGWLSQDEKSTWKVGAKFDIEISYEDLEGRRHLHRLPLLIADDKGFAGAFWSEPQKSTTTISFGDKNETTK